MSGNGQVIIPANIPCVHEKNVGLSFESGNPRKTFVWCRRCGAVFLPDVPEFTKHFENHAQQGGINLSGQAQAGVWILPDRFVR